MRHFIKIAVLLMMALLLPGIVNASESYTTINSNQSEIPVVDAPTFEGLAIDGLNGYGVTITPTTEGSQIMYQIFVWNTELYEWELVTDWTLYEGRYMEIWFWYQDGSKRYRVVAYAFIDENNSQDTIYEFMVDNVPGAANYDSFVWYNFVVDGIYYHISGPAVIVTKDWFSEVDSYFGDVIIPETVTYSGNTYSVTAICDKAFQGCSGLTSITIPNSVTSIGKDAFQGCTGLTSITIPSTVTSIGDGAFSNCSGLNTITVDNGNPVYDSRDNCNAIINTSDNKIIAGCKNTVIPNTITSIDGQELYYHETQNGFYAEEYEGYGAFSGIEMDSLFIPVTITDIGHGAFSGSYIKKIYYNSLDCGSYYYTGDPHVADTYCYPFEDCRADEFIIGNNIIEIPSGLAGGSDFSTVVIPYSVKSIGYYAFRNCGSLTAVIIPNSISAYCNLWDAFYGCYNLTDIYLIGEGEWKAGYLPSTVTKLYIDAGITSVNNLYLHPTDVFCFATVPPQCNSESFTDYSGTLHVPATSIAAYFTAPYWCNFANIVGDIVGINSIALSEDSIEIIAGKTFSLTAAIDPTDTLYDSFTTWQSSDNAIAIVNNGIVTGLAQGECDIIVSCLGKQSVCHVKVVSPISLSLDQTEVTLEKGDTFTLIATILPESESGLPITWSSSNTGVAVVDNGLVTAISEGQCDITATCSGARAICHVIVTNPIITITLDQQEAMLLPNHILTLIPSATPVMPEGFTVSSSDPSVAAARLMNGNVQVVGIKEGTTTITVGAYGGTVVPATCLVTVYTEPGDANCDGYHTISDVTTIINYLLSGDDTGLKVANADINNDGKVSITDVTTLISCLLSGEWPSVETDDHEWVDLGLPSGTLWATCNVGASAPEEFGDYFAWGETTPRDFYDWSAYNWSAGSSTTMTKYCTSSSYGYEGFTDNKTELDLEDDAAYVNWGKKWRMPTYEQYTELYTQCTWTWTTQNGVKGYLVTGPNGNTMFVPAAGYYSETTQYSAGTEGRYWLSTLYSDRADHSYCLYFNSGSVSWDDSRRYRGFSVRAVRASQH